jgi:hypothetical protein
MAGRTYALKLDQMREAKRLHAEGWSAAQLAERFNVSKNAVQNAFAYMGIPQRTQQQGREAARVSTYWRWKAERRRPSSQLANVITNWSAQ